MKQKNLQNYHVNMGTVHKSLAKIGFSSKMHKFLLDAIAKNATDLNKTGSAFIGKNPTKK